MRKFIFGVVCVLLIIGVANMGFALSLPWGSGGKSKGKGQGKGHQIGHHDNAGTVNPKPIPDYFLHYDERSGGGPNNGNGDNGLFAGLPNQVGTGYSKIDDGDRHTAPVPEPATMILLGMGLIGLAGFGRRKFTKQSDH